MTKCPNCNSLKFNASVGKYGKILYKCSYCDFTCSEKEFRINYFGRITSKTARITEKFEKETFINNQDI